MDDDVRIEDHDLDLHHQSWIRNTQKRSRSRSNGRRARGRKFQSPWFAQLSRRFAQILLRPSRVQHVLNDLTWLTVHAQRWS